MNLHNPPNFPTWSQLTLAQFATDAYAKLQTQEDIIASLRLDLKDAMNVIRKLNKEPQ